MNQEEERKGASHWAGAALSQISAIGLIIVGGTYAVGMLGISSQINGSELSRSAATGYLTAESIFLNGMSLFVSGFGLIIGGMLGATMITVVATSTVGERRRHQRRQQLLSQLADARSLIEDSKALLEDAANLDLETTKTIEANNAEAERIHGKVGDQIERFDKTSKLVDSGSSLIRKGLWVFAPMILVFAPIPIAAYFLAAAGLTTLYLVVRGSDDRVGRVVAMTGILVTAMIVFWATATFMNPPPFPVATFATKSKQSFERDYFAHTEDEWVIVRDSSLAVLPASKFEKVEIKQAEREKTKLDSVASLIWSKVPSLILPARPAPG